MAGFSQLRKTLLQQERYRVLQYIIYSPIAFVSGIGKGYTLLLGKLVPGSRSMAQSHGLCLCGAGLEIPGVKDVLKLWFY